MSVKTLKPAAQNSSSTDQSAAQFYGMIEASPFAALFVEEDGTVGYLNAKGQELFSEFAETFGFGPEELVGGSVSQLLSLSAKLK